MSDEELRDERDWAADKRDFVGDRRDAIADERDAAADHRDAMAHEREELANEREAELDERERPLDARAVELGVPASHTREERDAGAALRAGAAAQRDEAGRDRDRDLAERDVAMAMRAEADKQRHATTPTTRLAMAFAEIARHLFEADNFDEVLTRVVQTAVSTVSGCTMASVTIRDETGAWHTAAPTHEAAFAADQAQYEAEEGPCLDAIDEPVVHTPSLPDPRWPRLADRPLDAGVRGAVSYRLTIDGPITDDSLGGSLNAYAAAPDAFDDEAVEIGLILAAHASVAVRAIREREAVEQFSSDLHKALASRDVIGQAKGILMERLRITPDDAFDVLRRASQRLNVKLREIAETLSETGELP